MNSYKITMFRQTHTLPLPPPRPTRTVILKGFHFQKSLPIFAQYICYRLHVCGRRKEVGDIVCAFDCVMGYIMFRLSFSLSRPCQRELFTNWKVYLHTLAALPRARARMNVSTLPLLSFVLGCLSAAKPVTAAAGAAIGRVFPAREPLRDLMPRQTYIIRMRADQIGLPSSWDWRGKCFSPGVGWFSPKVFGREEVLRIENAHD